MVVQIAVIICFFACVTMAAVKFPGLHPDVGLNVAQLITKYGYPFENHTLVTADGYILELHRIPRGKTNTEIGRKGPVLMMPALFCDSSEFVNVGRNSFAFILADQGYDVWIGNPRGTTWSRKHVTLDPDKDKDKFWDFSAHELGIIDVATKIDYVLARTGEKKLFYIGHSQGTTLFFILMSSRPEYNSKIRLMTALAPAVHVQSMAGLIAPLILRYLERLKFFTGSHEVFRRGQLFGLAKLFCNDFAPTQHLCLIFLNAVAGFSKNQYNPSLIPVLVTGIPAGGSYKQFQHFSQFYTSGLFRQFDYGQVTNMVKYGQSQPPNYDISKVTAPIAAYYSTNDYLVTLQDALKTIRELPNVIESKQVEGLNHLDIVMGKEAPTLIFSDVLKLMDRY